MSRKLHARTTFEDLYKRPLPTANDVIERLKKKPEGLDPGRIDQAFAEHFEILGVKPVPIHLVSHFKEGYEMVKALPQTSGKEVTGRPVPTGEAEKAEFYARLWLPFVDAFEAGLWMFWIADDQVIGVPRPVIMKEDGVDRLHCADGPAVYWPGTPEKYYVYRGVQVPEQVIEDPHSMTSQQILTEQNAEVRRVMMERYGLGRLLQESKAKLIDSAVQRMLPGAAGFPKGGDAINELLQLELPGDPERVLLMIRMIDPSTGREYFARVHPECRPLLSGNRTGEPQRLTVLNAIASTFGLTGKEYHLAVES